MFIVGRRGAFEVARAALPVAVLALGIATGLAPTAAQAQFFNWGGEGGGWGGSRWGDDRPDYGEVGPGQVYRGLGERGFRVIAPLRRNGAVYVAEVVDRRGRRERVIVSAADGQILQRFVLAQPRAPQDASLMPGDDLEQQMDRVDRGDGYRPVPPGLIPNAGAPRRTYGTIEDQPTVEPIRPRTLPRPAKPVRPKLVDRTLEPPSLGGDPAPSQPTRLKVRPSEPMRLPGAPASHPEAPAVTASRPIEPVAKPVAPTPAPAQASAPASANAAPPPAPSRMRDPLAIPREDAKPAEVPKGSAASTQAPRSVEAQRSIMPGTVTGAPAPVAAANPAPAPTKAGDVPVAPLD